ncbi:carbonic anhydrase 6-like [Chelonus insularis]|uniref:carbonic anhydrase 6-like n=1 Tax=Chelonus insularis TaxID=460826 RepID=UPI00158D6418|nr:carbonic anhydrase 6-like [Chelonus insularis]
MVLFLNICLFIVFQLFDISSSTYTFRDADSWSIEYPQCGTEHQSPIDISTDQIQPGKYEQPFTIYNIDQPPNKFTLNNTGKGLKLTGEWDDDKIPTITGGPLIVDQYVFGCNEYYWSRENISNSPHKVDGESFALEVHAVYYKKNYGSHDIAKKYDDGIVIVVGVWEEWAYGEDTAISLITLKLPEVVRPGAVADIRPFSFLELLEDPSDPPTNYYTYTGSVIKPPCTPALYFIQNYIYPIKPHGMELFRAVQFENDDVSNVRPPQPLNDRVVYELERRIG